MQNNSEINLIQSDLMQQVMNKKYDFSIDIIKKYVLMVKNIESYDIDIFSDEYDTCNIRNLNNFTKMKCDIYIDKIWKFNEKFICKWKAKVIYLV